MNSKAYLRFFILVVVMGMVVITGLTACDIIGGEETPIENATLTGNPVRYDDIEEEYNDTYALIVLEQDGEEIERYFIDSDESLFEFNNLNEGNYKLKVYFTEENMIEKDVVIDDKTVSLGQIELEPAEIPSEEKNGTFVFSFDTEEEYVQDKNIRLAIAHAIDRKEIMNIFVDNIHNPDEGMNYDTELANRLSPPVVNDYAESQDINLNQDIEKANEYMSNIDTNEEITIDFYHFDDDIYAEIANSIEDSLANVDGLSINSIPVEEDSEIIDDKKSFHPIAMNFTRSPLRRHNIPYNNEMKELRQEAGINIDNPETFKDKILEYEKLIIEEGRIIPVFYRASYQDQ